MSVQRLAFHVHSRKLKQTFTTFEFLRATVWCHKLLIFLNKLHSQLLKSKGSPGDKRGEIASFSMGSPGTLPFTAVSREYTDHRK